MWYASITNVKIMVTALILVTITIAPAHWVSKVPFAKSILMNVLRTIVPTGLNALMVSINTLVIASLAMKDSCKFITDLFLLMLS